MAGQNKSWLGRGTPPWVPARCWVQRSRGALKGNRGWPGLRLSRYPDVDRAQGQSPAPPGGWPRTWCAVWALRNECKEKALMGQTQHHPCGGGGHDAAFGAPTGAARQHHPAGGGECPQRKRKRHRCAHGAKPTTLRVVALSFNLLVTTMAPISPPCWPHAAAGLQVDQWRVAFAADPNGADAPVPRAAARSCS